LNFYTILKTLYVFLTSWVNTFGILFFENLIFFVIVSSSWLSLRTTEGGVAIS